MKKAIQLLIVSKFSLTGVALVSHLSRKDSGHRVVFRPCMSREPLPDDFRPEVVILNCADRCPGGVPTSSTLYPFARCIIITRSSNTAQRVHWLRSGVHGIVEEATSLESLDDVIRAVLAGEVWASRKVLSAFLLDRLQRPEVSLPGGLNSRESEIMDLLRTGSCNASIARRLRLGEKTVKWYLTSIFRKLEVRSRTQAVIRFNKLQRRAVATLHS